MNVAGAATIRGRTTEETTGRPLRAQGRRPDLQGMRALAVLAVFVDHLFGWPSGGFVGVDVFFVLSGFFITALLIRERSAKGKLSFRHFYIRRVKRILPSALLVLVATVACAFLLLPAARAKATLQDALFAALFSANFRFEAVGADYFQHSQPPSPLQHYWSLSIEEQFYSVWPVLLVVIFALTRGLRRRGKPWVRQWGLFGAMAVVVGASFAWAMFMSSHDSNRAYFSTFTRVWELGVGALVAIAGPWLACIPHKVRPGLAYIGLAGVLASLFVITAASQFPAPWAALPVLSTALVIVSFHGGEVRRVVPLTNPLSRWLGDVSYTLYLWHWPVIILLVAVLPKGWWFYGTALSLAMGLTAVTYYFFEDPIRKSDWLLDKPVPKGRRMPTLSSSSWAVIGMVAIMIVVVAILGIRRDELSASTEAETYQPITSDLTAPAAKVDPCFGAPAMLDSSCVLRNPDVPLQPSIGNFVDDSQQVPTGCFRAETGDTLRPCTYGYNGKDATRIALVGDSHAKSILPAILPLLVSNKWQLTTYVGIACQWVEPPLSECLGGDAIQQALLAKPYDLVLTTAIRVSGSTDTDYERAWAPVAAAGSRIAVLEALPGVSEDSLACLTRVSFGADRTGDCGTSRAEAFEQPDALIAAAQLTPGTTLIDLTPFYCNADRCPSVIGNVIVYRDPDGHLTKTFARTLASAMENEIKRALGR